MTSPTTPSLPDALRACIEFGEKATPGEWTLHVEPASVGDDWEDKGGFRIDADDVEQLAYVWNKSRRIPVGGPQSEGPEFGSPSGEADAKLIVATANLIRQHGPALEALLREREWQPIESAPKDGTQILIAGGTFSVDGNGDMAFSGPGIAYWYDLHKVWRGEGAHAHDLYFEHKPSHWMPLPAGPNGAAGVEQPTGDSP